MLMAKRNVRALVTGALSLSQDEARALETLGLEVFVHPDERTAVADPGSYGIVICNALFQYQPVEEFTGLKLVHLTSAGLDRAPVDYFRSHGIRLFSAQGVYNAPMAEFALCGVLQLYKQSRFFYRNQLELRWEKHRGLMELTDKRVCVLGAGSVGRELAKRFSAFEAHVVGVDLFPIDSPAFEAVRGLDGLDEALETSDVVALTLPLSEETRHFMNAERLGRMKPGAVLVNISRGAVVDEAALVRSLRSGRLAGAVLDVFEEEPLPAQSFLWGMDNVILSPPNAFVSDRTHGRMMELIVRNVKGYLSGADA